MASEQQYIDLFQNNAALINAQSAEVLNAPRKAACADFCRLGFPTRRVERYKYTDVKAAFAPDYGVNLKRLDIPANPNDVFRCNVPNMSTSLYFVVNDAFYDKALPIASLPQGVQVCSLREAAQRMPQLVGKYYGQQANSAEDAITALNTMLAQDGLFVYIPKGIKVDRTLQIVNILRADFDLMANRRVLIVLEEEAEVSLLFCDHAVDNHNFLTTQVAEVFVGKGAQLQLYSIEETHVKNTRFANTYLEQADNSTLEMNTITLHNGVTRNRTDVVIKGENVQTAVYGCVVADKKQHVDNNALIDHQKGGGKSHVLYKYVLDDKAVGAFAGHVLVRKDAQHTESQETNANICASPDARMFTQPMLEIYADDVKCNHGSTVGQLNDSALFYMRQRGIPLGEARLLLQHAFVNEVIRLVALAPLRERLSHLVEMRFRGELEKCKGCGMCK
ncbi:MAG: Fe-S cluster assembly protein SufD [Bacteroidaceae bacterium]